MYVDNKVDAVYTWVNCDDPTWQREYDRSITKVVSKSSSHPSRFRDNNELYYSLLSLEKFAPWINNIFIVKKSYQFPPIHHLTTQTKKKIVWIDESILKPPELNFSEFYPTFNSLALEANFHRIPDLSEKFIYFNNDMFLGRAVLPDYFFIGNKARFAIKQQNMLLYLLKILAHRIKPNLIKGYPRHLLNSYTLFNQEIISSNRLGVPFYKEPLHQCYPLFKSGYQFIWNHAEIRKKLLINSASNFRTDNNIHPVLLLSLIYLSQGRAQLVVEDDIFIDLKKRNFQKKIIKLKRDRSVRFCINDGSGRNIKKNMKIFNDFLQDYFYYE